MRLRCAAAAPLCAVGLSVFLPALALAQDNRDNAQHTDGRHTHPHWHCHHHSKHVFEMEMEVSSPLQGFGMRGRS